MKRFAITGGIGSGKSFVCALFSKMGIPVYLSDARTKALYESDRELLASLAQVVGADVIKEGRLDKSLMAKRIFSNQELLLQVEALVHPAVVADFIKWADEQERLFAPPFVLMESAIVLEKPLVRASVEKVITLTAPMDVRLARIIARDGVGEEEAQRRIAVQWDDSKREALSHYIIVNDGVTPLLPQLERIVEAERQL
ncbi:MAG: dephospho-CoA kinase [Candidatus Egerieousia sp.]|nr:dephospho-CoA kinase [Candidatus Egerieousia sp.]